MYASTARLRSEVVLLFLMPLCLCDANVNCDHSDKSKKMCQTESVKSRPDAAASLSPPSAPSTPPTLVSRNKNDTCHKCRQRGHWARDCPSNTPKESLPAGHPTIRCPCGSGPCAIRVSRTDTNPGRVFYTCPVSGTDQCKFFKWCDKVTDDDIKLSLQLTPPKCRCGAGICKTMKESSGPNVGRSYFVCPIKRGLGACKFFEWESTQANTRVSERVDESKGYGSPQSPCDSQNSDLNKIDNSSVEWAESMGSKVSEVENPQDFSSFITVPISSAEDNVRLTESHINDPMSGSSTLKSTIGELVMQEAEALDSTMKHKVSRRISIMSQTEVHCRQIEFWRQISAAGDISSGGLHVLGWLGRLAFPPLRCLEDHPPRPFFCGTFPNLDPVFDPQDGDMLNLEGSNPLPHRTFKELSPGTPGADCQIWNRVLWKPSGFKRSFATVQSEIIISSFSESLEWTASPIQSIEKAADQFRKRLEQEALHFVDVFVTLLNTIDPSDQDTMTTVANKFFSCLDHVLLPINYEPFSRHVREFIESSSRLAEIEQSIHRESSLEELTELYNGDKVQFDDISKVHDKAVAAFANSSRRQQSLEEEASLLRDMLLQIENQLSSCKAETSVLKTRLDFISKDMLEYEKRMEESKNTLKRREQMEEERCAAKAALEQARIQIQQ